MNVPRHPWLRWETAALAAALVLPLVISDAIGDQLTSLFIFGILALGLNVVVGNTGLLHLGIAAFFGIGAYVTGIVTVPSHPFQWGFAVALVLSAAAASLLGIVLGAPTLRLRGDYLALVTLGFGEVVKVTLRNLEEITAGMKGLNPVPPPQMPGWVASITAGLGLGVDWGLDYRLFYYFNLAILVAVVLVLRNLEQSRLGRAWLAIREDELAATCIGINAARVKLSAFALSAALAGMAGCLYATKQTSTADPNAYDFNRSIIMLCCIILGGLGSIRGTLLGVALLLGFDNVLVPLLDAQLAVFREWLTERHELTGPTWNVILSFSNWKLMIFGLALVLMMRFRPDGLLPGRRMIGG